VLVAGAYIPSVDGQQKHYLTFILLGWWLNFSTLFVKNVSIVWAKRDELMK
jgi:hypothetical protein